MLYRVSSRMTEHWFPMLKIEEFENDTRDRLSSSRTMRLSLLRSSSWEHQVHWRHHHLISFISRLTTLERVIWRLIMNDFFFPKYQSWQFTKIIRLHQLHMSLQFSTENYYVWILNQWRLHYDSSQSSRIIIVSKVRRQVRHPSRELRSTSFRPSRDFPFTVALFCLRLELWLSRRRSRADYVSHQYSAERILKDQIATWRLVILYISLVIIGLNDLVIHSVIRYEVLSWWSTISFKAKTNSLIS